MYNILYSFFFASCSASIFPMAVSFAQEEYLLFGIVCLSLFFRMCNGLCNLIYLDREYCLNFDSIVVPAFFKAGDVFTAFYFMGFLSTSHIDLLMGSLFIGCLSYFWVEPHQTQKYEALMECAWNILFYGLLARSFLKMQ
jgi:hypothetical protein